MPLEPLDSILSFAYRIDPVDPEPNLSSAIFAAEKHYTNKVVYDYSGGQITGSDIDLPSPLRFRPFVRVTRSSSGDYQHYPMVQMTHTSDPETGLEASAPLFADQLSIPSSAYSRIKDALASGCWETKRAGFAEWADHVWRATLRALETHQDQAEVDAHETALDFKHSKARVMYNSAKVIRMSATSSRLLGFILQPVVELVYTDDVGTLGDHALVTYLTTFLGDQNERDLESLKAMQSEAMEELPKTVSIEFFLTGVRPVQIHGALDTINERLLSTVSRVTHIAEGFDMPSWCAGRRWLGERGWRIPTDPHVTQWRFPPRERE